MAFPSNCNPRIISVDQSTGCSLTRANIVGMTPQLFEDQGFREVGMDRIITNSQEAKVAGYIENNLEMLLMSRLAPLKGGIGKVPMGQNPSVILPYIYRRQRRNVNSNFWTVYAGAATTGAGSGSIPASAWNLTVRNNPSTFASTLTNIERYFLPGKYFFVETVNATTKVAYSLQYKILASVNADSGGTAQALLTLVPNVSAATWAGYTSGQKLVYQPTAGTGFVLAASVSDYESYGGNEVAENSNKLLEYWLQTTRFVHEYTDEYLLALNAALTSGYFKDFRQLPLAEQKRRMHAQYMKSWWNSVLFGQRISDLQAVETYTSLPTVEDPNNPGCVLEYKANALGVKQQLIDCTRYLDLAGAALDLDTVVDIGYLLKRAREADGGTIDTIDIMVPRETSGQILQMMNSFYKAKYGVDITRFYQPNVPLKFENETVWNYNLYQLPDDLGGFNLAVWSHNYFSDKVSAATGTDQQSRARTAWMIDWTDVKVAIGATNSVKRETNIYDNLWNYVMKINMKHVMMESMLWTTIIEDASRHYVIDNFSSACPTLTVSGCSV